MSAIARAKCSSAVHVHETRSTNATDQVGAVVAHHGRNHRNRNDPPPDSIVPGAPLQQLAGPISHQAMGVQDSPLQCQPKIPNMLINLESKPDFPYSLCLTASSESFIETRIGFAQPT